MRKEYILELLSLLKISYNTLRGEWIMVSCPFAEARHQNKKDSRPSFGIKIGNVSGYNCFACGVKGKLRTLPYALSVTYGKDFSFLSPFIEEHEGVELLELPNEDKIKVAEILSEHEINCLPSFSTSWRSITPKILKLYNIRQSKKHIVFPMYDSLKRLVGIKYREGNNYWIKGGYKGVGVFFGMHLPFKKGKFLFIVEGERDVMLLKQQGIANVWGISGGLSYEQIAVLKKVSAPLVFFLDNDPTGVVYLEKLKKCLRGYTELYEITKYYGCKDPAELYEKGKLNMALKSILFI